MMYKHEKGMTLIELLIYVAVVGILVGMVVSLYFGLARARTKGQGISEVERQGYNAMSIMAQSVRNARGILLPQGITASTSMSIDVYDASSTPTWFYATSSVLYMQEGSSSPVALTNNAVVVSNVSFTNLTASTTDGSIKMQFTLTSTLRNQYGNAYSANFYTAATVRNQQ